MNDTKIEYCDATLNLITGCLGPDGKNPCGYCYARRLAYGRLRDRYLNGGVLLTGDQTDPFAPRWWPERMAGKLSKDPSVIFLNNMGDGWGDWVPIDIVQQILRFCHRNPQHTFLHLTKNPYRYLPFLDRIPPNCWLGATSNIAYGGNDDTLARVKSEIKRQGLGLKTFVSYEPLIAGVPGARRFPMPDWVIVGGQTRPTRNPGQNLVFDIIAQAKMEKVPVFLKNNLVNSLGLEYVRDHQKTPFKKGDKDAG